MAYTVYLDGVALPVTPSKLQMKIKNQNKTITLINEGEVNMLKAAGLTEISFTAEIPHIRYPYAFYPGGFREAAYYMDKLEALKTGLQPFQFLCSRISPAGALLFDTNLKVSLEDYRIDEDAKSGQALNVVIKLKQYRKYGTKTVSIETNQVTLEKTATIQEDRSTESAPELETYVVKSGDTLWNIAKLYLGDGSRYPEIASTNDLANPNLIVVGQELTMPA